MPGEWMVVDMMPHPPETRHGPRGRRWLGLLLLALAPSTTAIAASRTPVGTPPAPRPARVPDWAARLGAPDPQQVSPEGVVLVTNVRYAPQRATVGDFYFPPGHAFTSAPAACVMNIHGGGFTRGNHFNAQLNVGRDNMSEWLAQNGFVVFNINYTLLQRRPDGTFAGGPVATMEEALQALAYLRTNASRCNLDARRMALMGGSAGATVAAMIGVLHPADLRAVVAWSPFVNLADGLRQYQHYYVPQIRKHAGSVDTVRRTFGRMAKEYSAIHHVSSNAVPMFVYAGGLVDTPEMQKSAAAFVDRLSQHGRTSVYVFLADGEHAGGDKALQTFGPRALRFLREASP